MQGPAHLATGWLIGEYGGLTARQDRRIVGLAGIAPDIDVIAYPLAYLVFPGDLDSAYAVYAQIHHHYTHGVLFAIIYAILAWKLATTQNRIKVSILAVLAVFLHLVGDVIASGPNWPIYPLEPFSDLAWGVTWSVNASDWRNVLLSMAAIAIMLWYSYSKHYSWLECFSYSADDWMARVMRGEVTSSKRFRVVLYVSLFVISALVLLPLLFYFH